ncbi:MAG: hypothetical protein IJ409_01215 [Lachnospiraceae bacterium]|nr:hypothetical protein [Lachnospiraceae bacterium]
MVMVDVEVPALDRIYDFELDEEVDVRELTDTMVLLIVQNEKPGFEAKGQEELHLYALRQGKVLNSRMTLKQQGVQSGDGLVLI